MAIDEGDEDEQAPAGAEAILADEDLVKNGRLRGRDGCAWFGRDQRRAGIRRCIDIQCAFLRASEIDSAFCFTASRPKCNCCGGGARLKSVYGISALGVQLAG